MKELNVADVNSKIISKGLIHVKTGQILSGAGESGIAQSASGADRSGIESASEEDASGIEPASGANRSGIESASGQDSSGIQPVSGADESGEGASGEDVPDDYGFVESGAGTDGSGALGC